MFKDRLKELSKEQLIEMLNDLLEENWSCGRASIHSTKNAIKIYSEIEENEEEE